LQGERANVLTTVEAHRDHRLARARRLAVGPWLAALLAALLLLADVGVTVRYLRRFPG